MCAAIALRGETLEDRSLNVLFSTSMQVWHSDGALMIVTCVGESIRRKIWLPNQNVKYNIQLIRIDIITARKRSCGKVMFLHLSVSHSVHRGVSAIHPRADTPLGRHPPGKVLGHFLFIGQCLKRSAHDT